MYERTDRKFNEYRNLKMTTGFISTCVFVKQSPGPFHCDLLRGTPYSEVTGLICRVP